MKEHLTRVIWPIALKTAIPAFLGAAGAIAAALYNDGFRAFCGLS